MWIIAVCQFSFMCEKSQKRNGGIGICERSFIVDFFCTERVFYYPKTDRYRDYVPRQENAQMMRVNRDYFSFHFSYNFCFCSAVSLVFNPCSKCAVNMSK